MLTPTRTLMPTLMGMPVRAPTGAVAVPPPFRLESIDLGGMLSLHFMVNAYRAGTIVAVTAGVVGWFMVLRRQSFAGHTLAVVSFPGAAGAVWLGLSATLGYFAGSIAAAAVIALVPRSTSGRALSQESAVIGTLQAFALACGALFVSLYGGFLDSLTGLLFGTFLGISDRQVVTLGLVAAAVLVVMAVIGRPLFFATVDADVAAARRVPVRILSVLFLLVLGCTAAEVSQITGALLVFALLVMPAAAAQQLTVRPGLSLVLTVVLGVAVTWVSLAVAYTSVYPVGFYVSTIGFAVYVAAASGRALATRLGSRPRSRNPIAPAPSRAAVGP
jgi:zinc/manganese transport system permease protein